MPLQGQAKRRPAAQAVDKPVKRTRVSRACDQCRIAREKCDGLQPICSTCSGSKRKCTYTANPKKRGIQPGYIRTLELALAWLFQQNPENESLLNGKLGREGASSLFLSRDSKDSNRLHKRWRKARFYSEVEKLLSGGESSRQEQSEHFSPQSDDDDDSDAEEIPATVKNFDHSSPPENRASQPHHQRSGSYSSQYQVTAIMPVDSWRLFEAYFAYTQSWLPICEKYDILKLSYSYPIQGLPLSFGQSDSGAHAELWSVLAVGSLHAQINTDPTSRSTNHSMMPEQLYAIARSLIPNELGHFDIGHVKAFLNLAVFNMVQSLPEAAWILLGCASRVLEAGDQLKLMESPRHKHVFSGCFLLDSVLALRLGRRPHFRKYDVELLGKITEDSIEEWEPWNGQFHGPSVGGPRAPILALSTFNNLLDVVDILVSHTDTLPNGNPDYNISNRLEGWRGSLPSRLNYILSDVLSTPLNPPAILLQTAYYCAALASLPSASWLNRILDLLEQCQQRVGSGRLPPMIGCLMVVIQNLCANLSLDDITHRRLQTLQMPLFGPHITSAQKRLHEPNTSIALPRVMVNAVQMATPESLKFPLSTGQAPDRQVGANISKTASAQTNTLFPKTHSAMTSDPSFDQLLMVSSPAQSDPRYPEVPGDLESFFDELASLDTTARPNNQPQFMQNLGFAPNSTIDDLFSDYIPIQSSAFIARDDADPVAFDQYGFYGTN